MESWFRARALTLRVLLWSVLVGGVQAGALEEGGKAYADGDYAAAARLWWPLAQQGEARAQRRLGLLHAYGQGVEKDLAQAYVWLNLAVARLPAGPERDGALRERDRIGVYLSPAQIGEAQARALEWTPQDSPAPQDENGLDAPPATTPVDPPAGQQQEKGIGAQLP